MMATIEEYNAHVVDEHTEGLEVEKTAKAFTIDTPPYYGFYPLKLGCSTASGGVGIDAQGHVLQADGVIIKNLYAAGEVIGGLSYSNCEGRGMGGMGTPRCCVFGRVIAETALAE